MSDKGALVYVVDDDSSAREGLARLIRSAGLLTKTFASAEEFLAVPRPRAPSCLVLDMNLPGINGLDLQHELAESGAQLPIVFITGHGDIPMAVRAVRAGAANFLTKPFDDEDLLNAVRQSISYFLDDEILSDQNVGNMVGESPGLQRVLKAIRVVAPTDSTVLIEGETGTGKELVARAIHDLSRRSQRSFVEVNCAAIPAALLESELFGHEKGSFTGAFAQKIGRFERAHQGTLFLDEIGELPLELQPKLLRALQEHEFERLGGNRTVKVDVRIVAATNRDLGQMVAEGKFRSDLYYRLNVFPVAVPPLRERREDIPLLTRFFTQRYAGRLNRTIKHIPSATLEALSRHEWPGNVRELQNVIERAVILCKHETLSIHESWMPNRASEATRSGSTLRTNLATHEREVIEAALRHSRGRISGPSGAAVKLGLPRSTLESKIESLGIDKHAFKPKIALQSTWIGHPLF
jgi:DNA-binding NtrC family response regulator